MSNATINQHSGEIVASKDVAAPKDAAAVILLRANGEAHAPEIFWARRGAELNFLPGCYAFPGGGREASDFSTPILNAPDSETSAMICCAARELFEELGVMLAHGDLTPNKKEFASFVDDFHTGRLSFTELLERFNLHLDADDFTFAGRWVTPPFSPRRFDTWFFLVECPADQEPRSLSSEFEEGEWISATDALVRWQRAERLVAPPVLHALKTLAAGMTDDLVERFLSVPHAHREPARRIEFLSNFICFPLRTPTHPPATYTNCYIVGGRELVVIDPASPHEDEQAALAAMIDKLLAEGRGVREIILTHHHPDHIGGVAALQSHLAAHGRVSVAAHRLTAGALEGVIRVDRLIEDSEMLHLDGDWPLHLRAMHTPGHARGHLCFYEERTGALITGDNVVGFGSVLIDPREGDMRDYLESLRKLRALPHVSVLLGGHGPVVGTPYAKIDEYIAHRLERERSILAAVEMGASEPAEIVARVYTDVPSRTHQMAESAVISHLQKLETDGFVARGKDGRYIYTALAT